MLDNVIDIGNIPDVRTAKKHSKGPILHDSGGQPRFLHEIMRTHYVLLSSGTRAVGMPPAKLALLRLLAISYPDKIGIMELARQLEINAAAVTRQVKEAEAEHLVIRIPDSRDGRRNYVKLSSEGVRIFAHLHKRAHDFEALLCREIGPRDLEIVIRALSKVRIAVEKYSEEFLSGGFPKMEQ